MEYALALEYSNISGIRCLCLGVNRYDSALQDRPLEGGHLVSSSVASLQTSSTCQRPRGRHWLVKSREGQVAVNGPVQTWRETSGLHRLPAASLLELKRSRPHSRVCCSKSMARSLYCHSILDRFFISADTILLDLPLSPSCVAFPPSSHHSPGMLSTHQQVSVHVKNLRQPVPAGWDSPYWRSS